MCFSTEKLIVYAIKCENSHISLFYYFNYYDKTIIKIFSTTKRKVILKIKEKNMLKNKISIKRRIKIIISVKNKVRNKYKTDRAGP